MFQVRFLKTVFKDVGGVKNPIMSLSSGPGAGLGGRDPVLYRAMHRRVSLSLDGSGPAALPKPTNQSGPPLPVGGAPVALDEAGTLWLLVSARTGLQSTVGGVHVVHVVVSGPVLLLVAALET